MVSNNAACRYFYDAGTMDIPDRKNGAGRRIEWGKAQKIFKFLHF